MLQDLDGKAVFDLTPGSGACARACLELGVAYVGLCRCAEHASWLQNVLDRHALLLMTRQGTPLFEQDMAQCVTEHFQDVQDQLNSADACVDRELEEDLD